MMTRRLKVFTSIALALVISSVAAAKNSSRDDSGLSERSGHVLRGPRVGNGGGVWLCHDQKTLDFRWMQLTDLYEAEVEFGLVLRKFKTETSWQIFDQIRKEIASTSFELATLLSDHAPDDLASVIKIMPEQGMLTVIDDGLYKVRPSTNSCRGGYIYYGQIANYTDDGRLLISERLWSHPTFSENQRAALLIHEIIYKALREASGDRNSVRSRHIVGVLFSTLPEGEKAIQIDRILKVPAPPGEESSVSMYPVQLTCTARVVQERHTIETAQGDITVQDSEVLVRSGDKLRTQIRDYQFLALTDAVDGKPTLLKITDLGTGAVASLDSQLLGPAFLQNRPITLSLKGKAQDESALLTCWAEIRAL